MVGSGNAALPGHVFCRLQSVLIEGDFRKALPKPSLYGLLRGGQEDACRSAVRCSYFRMLLQGYCEGIDGAGWKALLGFPVATGVSTPGKPGSCAGIPGCHGPARACPMRSTRRSSRGSGSDRRGGCWSRASASGSRCLEHAGQRRRCEHRGGTGEPGDAGARPRRAASRHPRPGPRAWTASARAQAARTRTGSRRAVPRPRSPRWRRRHDPSGLQVRARGGSGHRAVIRRAPPTRATRRRWRRRWRRPWKSRAPGGRGTDGRRPAECVTDKGYRSRSVLKALDDGPWKTRMSEPKQGFARWHGDGDGPPGSHQQPPGCYRAVAGSLQAARRDRRALLCAQPRSALRHAPRPGWRARERAQAIPVHVAGHNLSLLMRKLIGAGTPREAVAGGYGCSVLIAPTGAVLVAQMVLIVGGWRNRLRALCFAGVKPGRIAPFSTGC